MGELLPFRRAETTATERAEGPGSRVVPPPREVARPSGPEPLWREAAGAVLRERRHGLEQTLAQVARRAGVSVQYLSEVERGRKEPSSEVLAAVSGALQLTLVDLTRLVLHRLTPLDVTSMRPTRPGPPVRGPGGPVALAA
jgi:DNA-binding XRE family transcriptional regulator